MTLQNLKKDLHNLSTPEKAKILQGFFKTGKGQYGEGDIFIGVTVPNSRKVARKYIDLELDKLQELIKSKIHEERLVALLILVERFDKTPKEIFEFYSQNTKYINNWDLVDLTAHKIFGRYLFTQKNHDLLFDFANSKDLWKKRIAMVSMWYFIKNESFESPLKIAKILLYDKHDLIHKAVGWMLREIGKRNLEIEKNFLNKYCKKMPRTMLRYAIEKFEESERQKYLKL